jgi:hypothetical protein
MVSSPVVFLPADFLGAAFLPPAAAPLFFGAVLAIGNRSSGSLLASALSSSAAAVAASSSLVSSSLESSLLESPSFSVTRLVIPVFRNLFFGPKKPFLTGFLRIFFLRFPEEFFTGTWFWRGCRNSCFFPLLQEFFAGIPAGQEFLYLLRIPQESGGFWRIPVPAKSCWLWLD